MNCGRAAIEGGRGMAIVGLNKVHSAGEAAVGFVGEGKSKPSIQPTWLIYLTSTVRTEHRAPLSERIRNV